MKAQFVYENVHFQKGRDPKAVMGLGVLNPEIKEKLERMFLIDHSGRTKEVRDGGYTEVQYPKVSVPGRSGWGILHGRVIIENGQLGFEVPSWNTGPTKSVLKDLLKATDLAQYVKLSPIDYDYREHVYLFPIKSQYLDKFREGEYNIKDDLDPEDPIFTKVSRR
jgi:hypothetical protein